MYTNIQVLQFVLLQLGISLVSQYFLHKKVYQLGYKKALQEIQDGLKEEMEHATKAPNKGYYVDNVSAFDH